MKGGLSAGGKYIQVGVKYNEAYPPRIIKLKVQKTQQWHDIFKINFAYIRQVLLYTLSGEILSGEIFFTKRKICHFRPTKSFAQ